jgi:predicted ATPase/ribosome-binding protein aMBF1 (putative translation factor)
MLMLKFDSQNKAIRRKIVVQKVVQNSRYLHLLQTGNSMAEHHNFGDLVRMRRRQLDLTRAALAQRIGCSPEMIKKIEMGERRPSRELALLLAQHLDVALDEQSSFVQRARRGPNKDSSHALGNLPAPLTRLLGRKEEVAALGARVLKDRVRLLTVTGVAGVGKTRLAIEVAHTLRPHFPGGVWFISLAAIDDPNVVHAVIAATLDLPTGGTLPLPQRLQRAYGNTQLLLLLDNFEQVADAAPLLSEVLQACANISALVTSRAPLALYGEHEFEVTPLALPPKELWKQPAALAGYPVVRLCTERITAFQPNFALDSDNGPLLAELCTRLDGIPLAIELAAAQLRRIAPATLLAELIQSDQSLELLTTTTRDLPARQRTLYSAIAASFDLLSKNEQLLFAQLGVFAGSFDLAAVQAVCLPTLEPSAVQARLQLLVTSHLLQVDASEHDEPQPNGVSKQKLDQEPGRVAVDSASNRPTIAPGRFYLFETLRKFAFSQLQLSTAYRQTRRQHAAYFAQMAAQFDITLTASEVQSKRALLRRHYANLMAALHWSSGAGADLEQALTLAGGLALFWYLEGLWLEGIQWLDQVLVQAGGESRRRARAVAAQGLLHGCIGNYEAANAHFRAGLTLAQMAHDDPVCAWILMEMAHYAELQGDYRKSVEYAQMSLELYRSLGEARYSAMMLERLALAALESADYQRAAILLAEGIELYTKSRSYGGLGSLLNAAGMLELAQGNPDQALAYFRRAHTAFDESEHSHGLAWTSRNLALANLHLNQPQIAARHMQHALELYRELGSRGAIAMVLEGAAGVAALQAEWAAAAQLYGAAQALRTEFRLPLSANALDVYSPFLESVQAHLTPEEWTLYKQNGHTLSSEHAQEVAMRILNTSPTHQP